VDISLCANILNRCNIFQALELYLQKNCFEETFAGHIAAYVCGVFVRTEGETAKSA
jgi:hypothetical protein